MNCLRRAFPILVAVVTTWLLTTASGAAQSSIPNGVFVKNSEGLMTNTPRPTATPDRSDESSR